MTCSRCTARCLLTVCLAAATVDSARPVDAETKSASLPVQGERIEGDAPATYRLPLIGLCDPADEGRIAGNEAKTQVADATAAVETAPAKHLQPDLVYRQDSAAN